MDGLMMDFPLTLTHLLKRAEQFFPEREIVTRMPDKSFHRTTYADTMRRSRQLAAALGAKSDPNIVAEKPPPRLAV